MAAAADEEAADATAAAAAESVGTSSISTGACTDAKMGAGGGIGAG